MSHPQVHNLQVMDYWMAAGIAISISYNNTAILPWVKHQLWMCQVWVGGGHTAQTDEYSKKLFNGEVQNQ